VIPKFRSTIFLAIHPSARKHGISDADIEHAVNHAMSIDDQEDDLRLYLGPARNADLIEVATVVRGAREEAVVHAMKMRPKYRRFLPGE
jgi:GNAT superfamily N-acetyltransferase